MSMKTKRLGTELFISFGAILVVILLIAASGFIGFRNVLNRVENQALVNRLAQEVLEVRRQEKNYIIRVDEESIARVETGLDRLSRDAQLLQDRQDRPERKAPFAAVQKETDQYRQAFQRFVHLSRDKQAAMKEMDQRAADVLTAAETITSHQTTRLEQAQSETNRIISQLLAKTHDAQTLVRFFLEIKSREEQYAISGGNTSWQEAMIQSLEKGASTADELRTRLNDPRDLATMDTVLAAIDGYRVSFDELSQMLQAIGTSMQEMKVWTQTAADECIYIREYQQEVIQKMMVTSESGAGMDVPRLFKTIRFTEDVHRLATRFSEIREDQKDAVLSWDKEDWPRIIGTKVQDTMALAQDLADRADDYDTQDMLTVVVDALNGFKSSFWFFQTMMEKQNPVLKNMHEISSEALTACETLRARQEDRLHSERADAEAFVKERLRNAMDTIDLMRGLQNCRLDEKKYAMTGDSHSAEAVNHHIQEMITRARDLEAHLKIPRDIEQIQKMLTGIIAYREAFLRFSDSTGQQVASEQILVTSARQVVQTSEAALDDQKTLMNRELRFSTLLVGGGSLAGILIGLLLAWRMTRKITVRLRRVIQGLNQGALQVKSACGEMATASRSLAEGSSVQAAAIEETGVSLDEITSRTQQNADHAQAADKMIRAAGQMISRAESSMTDLTRAMTQITASADETAKIVRTIDEIAFQTNLLALNAAVEAAKAGGAGASFAVVADEVRNLAIRSAASASNTAELIRETREKISMGADVVEKTSRAFTEILVNVEKIEGLVDEISGASSEQARDITQIKQAVAKMNQIVQQVAAHAEQTASASRQMEGHTDHMGRFVDQLVHMAGASHRKGSHSGSTGNTL
jgi:methyl-accepting chemotaxis protein